MTDVWAPLPPEVAEWMGLDETMVDFALDLARRPAVRPPAAATVRVSTPTPAPDR